MRRTVLRSLAPVLLLGSIAAAAAPPATGVTTTWAPDPFPNVAPRARDRSAAAELNTPARTPSVLLEVYDVENDPLSVESFTQPAHGKASANPDGTFNYTPSPGYLGDDAFQFTITDGRGGRSTATMHLHVEPRAEAWPVSRFVGMHAVEAGGKAIDFGRGPTVPRCWDVDGDGRIDLLVAADHAIWFYRNIGSKESPRFAPGVKIKAGGHDLKIIGNRAAVCAADLDGDGHRDLIFVDVADLKLRWCRNLTAVGGPAEFAAPLTIKTADGEDQKVADIRLDVADFTGDGLADLVTGNRSGSVKIAKNVGTATSPRFDAPQAELDARGVQIRGSYNLNPRVIDLDLDGRPDFILTSNWGTIERRRNSARTGAPVLEGADRLSVSGPDGTAANVHSLTDGAIPDFADLNGDGKPDIVFGGESSGKIYLARGAGLHETMVDLLRYFEQHPHDLGARFADPANAAEADRLRDQLAMIYDGVTSCDSPSLRHEVTEAMLKLIASYPQYFKQQTFDIKTQAGLATMAPQAWLDVLAANPYDPAVRHHLVEAAGIHGAYRKLIEEIGVIYADNHRAPQGAEAVYQWMRTIPREVYPGNIITVRDWVGTPWFVSRGHRKNTFGGSPTHSGEYAFGPDAHAVIGDRGSENWYITVFHHEVSHDLDAYVRQFPDLTRRWGQTLVLAGGPDMRADPETGWLSWDLTRKHFKEAGLWDGDAGTWDAAWKQYWSKPPGSDWKKFGFMRGNIGWFLNTTQESLATQGNQYWNSTEGRIEVALERWNRGYKSDLTEVLFFMDIWSIGLDKMKFYENDNACNQAIRFARLHRNRRGYIDGVEVGSRRYGFTVDDKGVVTAASPPVTVSAR